MAARAKPPPSADELSSVKATEFGKLKRQTGWKLAWLVVSTCERPGQGSRTDLSTSGQVSLSEFARQAGVSRSTVNYYYNAWELAHAESVVPCAAKDVPVTVEWSNGQIVPPDEFQLDDDDLLHPWSFFYAWAKTGERPNPKQHNDSAEAESHAEPSTSGAEAEPSPPTGGAEAEATPPELTVIDGGDTDADFGLPSAAEVLKADTANQAERLKEILETVRAQADRLSKESEIFGDNDQLLAEIISAAEDLKVALVDKRASAA